MVNINSIHKIRYWLIILFFVALPFERIFTFEFASYTIKLSYIFGIILLLYFLCQVISKKINISLYKEELYLLLFALLAVLSTLWSIDWPRSLVVSLMILLSVLIFYALRRLVDPDLRQKLFSLIIVIGFLVSLFALWQFFIDKTSLSQFSYLREQYKSAVFGFPRVQSTFLEPLYLANFLLIPIFLGIYFEISNFSTRIYQISRHSFPPKAESACDRRNLASSRLFAIRLFLLVTATAFFLTLSRGAYLALAISLVLFFGMMLFTRTNVSKLIKPLLILILSFGIAVLCILSVGGTSGLKKYFGHAAVNDITTGESVIDRKDTMSIAISQFYHHPFGIGAGAFGALPEFKGDIPLQGYQTVNNLYLEILVEEGFLGIILFILFLVYYLVNLAREGVKNKLFLIMSLSLISALLIQYLFFSTLYIMYVWVILAMLSPKLAQNHKS